MKKIFTFLLSLTFLLQTVAFANGKASAKTEEMLKTVKERIGETDEYDKVTANSQTSEDGTVYSFSWSYDDNGEYKSLDVSIKESGIITHYSKYSSDRRNGEKLSVNRLSADELMKKAQAFSDRLNPSLAEKIKVISAGDSDDLSDRDRYFTVQRYENDIPVLADTGSISISVDGEVSNFWIDYTDTISFETADSIISRDDAKKAFEENFGFELCYIKKWNGRKKEYENMLVWQPAEGHDDEYISAVNGETVKRIFPEYDGYLRAGGFANAKSEMAADEGGGNSALTEAEIKALDTVAGLISQDEAEKKIRSLKPLKISGKMKLKSIGMYHNEHGEKTYIYNMQFDDGNSNSAFASINAETGELLRFYSYPSGDTSDKVPDTNKFKKLAESALKSLAPTYFPAKDENNSFRFSPSRSDGNFIWYDRYVNGIRCGAEYISLGFDTANNNITSFNLIRTKNDFPSPDSAITATEAAKAIFDEAVFEPVYIFTCSKEGLKKYDKAIAVYNLGGNTVIDALTGKPADENVKAEADYTDISGHYAETAITTLCRYRIGYAGESFKPSEYITQKDFIAFLYSAFQRYGSELITDDYDYSSAYRYAYDKGIISAEERDPEAAVTREQAAVAMVSALGYREVADIDGIYKPMFSDVSSNIGSISILAGMKVIGGDGNGNFNPGALLTRGDAAVILYNYLSR